MGKEALFSGKRLLSRRALGRGGSRLSVSKYFEIDVPGAGSGETISYSGCSVVVRVPCLHDRQQRFCESLLLFVP